jgi:chromate reductase, NAD(P)H dehydrogenase (quinone)
MNTQINKIIAFGASNSSNSINKKLASYTANLFKDVEVETLDLNNYEMPIYSIEREQRDGIHPLAIDFYNKLESADLIIISFAEYNGSYTAAFKNIFDWISRINNKTFQNKTMILMATSPGGRGGKTVLENALNRFPHHGADIVGNFHLPSFNQNFVDGEIINLELKDELNKMVASIKLG